MEKSNELERLGLVHRTIAVGLAVAATCLIGTSVAFMFSGTSHATGIAAANSALTPLRAVFGG